MRPFEYVSPATLDDALALIDGARPGARLLAGGTDLLTLIKADLLAPAQLVNIKRLDGLGRAIEERGGQLRIGALATLAEIERHRLVQERYAALAEAAAVAATPQLRNMATLGGNVLQRPRCWYFRSPRFDCWLKGGEECFARDGENQHHALFGGSPCCAAHPSDLAPALLALDAAVRLRGQAGERTLPIGEFFAVPEEARRIETILDDELVLEIQVPEPGVGLRSTYLKAMDRKAWAFALAGVAAALRIRDGRVEQARLVLSGVAPIPWRVPAAEQLLEGAEITPELIGRVSRAALEGAQPLARNRYKVALTESLVRRALEQLAAQEVS
jgi:xanthine dehydrogenase YagS FAD-binding subunit